MDRARVLPRAAILLFLLAAAPDVVRGQNFSDDEQQVRAVAGQFFQAYAAKDMTAFMALWTKASPDFAARQQTMQKLFAETGPIEAKSIEVVRVAFDAATALAIVRVELSGIDIRNGRQHPFLGKLVRAIECVRGDGAWKVNRYGPVERFVAERLAAATSEAERQSILEANKDAVNVNLAVAMLNLAETYWSHQDFANGRRLIDLAFIITDRLDNPSMVADCHMALGRLFEAKGNFEPARDEFLNARGIYQTLKLPDMEARAMYNAAGMLRLSERFDEAIATYQEALELSRAANDKLAEAKTQNNLGVAYERIKKFAEAGQAYESSLALKRELGMRSDEANTLVNLARTYGATNDHARAIASYRAAITIYAELGNKVEQLDPLLAIGWQLHALAAYADELAVCDEALAIARDIRDARHEIYALSQSGVVYECVGRYAEARANSEACLRLAREHGFRDSEGSALHNLGNAQDKLGQPLQALESYNAALVIAREIHDTVLESDALGNIAAHYFFIGEYGRAITMYEQIVSAARDADDQARLAQTLGNISSAYTHVGRYPDALKAIEEALKINREAGNRHGEAYQWSNLSSYYMQLADNAKAREANEKAMKIARDIGDRDFEAQALEAQGILQQRAGEYGKGIESLEAALRIDREIGDKAHQVAVMIDFGDLYQHIGRYADALASLEPALEGARALGLKKDEAEALRHLGHVYFFQADYAKALEMQQASRAIAVAIGNKLAEANALLGMGQALMLLERTDETIRAYESGLAISRELGLRSFEANFLANIGNAYLEQKQYNAALERAEQARQIAVELDEKLLLALTHQLAGNVALEQQRWSAAADAYRSAIESFEAVRAGAREYSMQMSLIGKHGAVYYALSRCLIELRQPVETFTVSEQAKARTLVEIIESGHGDVRKLMSADERREEQQLEATIALYSAESQAATASASTKRLATARESLDRARAEYDAFRRRLYLAHPQLQTERAAFAPATLEVLNLGLFARDPTLCVLSYFANESQTLLFVLTAGERPDEPATLIVHQLPGLEKELAAAVDAFRTACQDPRTDTAAVSERLYRALLAPAEAQLAGKRHLVVIPDSSLNSIPFHALQDPTGKYLLERFAVSYAPSVTALLKIVELHDGRPANRGDDAPIPLLAVGRPAFRSELSDLPGTADEVQGLGAMFGSGALVLLGDQANETAVKQALPHARFVHFATHGLLNEAAPLYSAIALAPSPQDDGRLEAREILDISLHADLTVLSACQTALGQRMRGEGVLGLTWSLFAAGSPTSVVTLWSVPDKATSSLMIEFYRRMLASPVPTKVEALRQAQQWLIREGVQQPGLVRGLEISVDKTPSAMPNGKLHPYYWAAFVLSGDWR
ncbi:MAG TPA: CHAT domain-containing protein [Pirellulales bacterium]|nr:CHAT domain-containing protein [Pirellulales bacterium]